MSIDRLRYFAAVVETRNLRKAAELVGISPPSMSKAISVLEGELGKKLIRPEGRGIDITAEGIEIYRLSTLLLDEYRRFHRNVQKGERESSQIIRIATFEVFSSYFLSSFLAFLGRDFEVLLLEMPPGKIEQAILSGTVDCGITYLPSPDPNLDYLEIGKFEFGIFGRKTWMNVAFDQLPFAIPITEFRIYSSEFDSLDMWPRMAPVRKIKYQFELLETALQTSRKGLSVLHCPDFVIRLHNAEVASPWTLVRLPSPQGYRVQKSVPTYLVGRKGNVHQGLERKLAKFMRTLK